MNKKNNKTWQPMTIIYIIYMKWGEKGTTKLIGGI